METTSLVFTVLSSIFAGGSLGVAIWIGITAHKFAKNRAKIEDKDSEIRNKQLNDMKNMLDLLVKILIKNWTDESEKGSSSS